MRIELNAGGLGRSTVNDFQDHLNRLISEAQNNADAFGTVKNAIYNLNGGVANMQHAMDLLQARETHEQDRKDYLQAVANQYNDFLNLAFRQDDQAAGLFESGRNGGKIIDIRIHVELGDMLSDFYKVKAIRMLDGANLANEDSGGDDGLIGKIIKSIGGVVTIVLDWLFGDGKEPVEAIVDARLKEYLNDLPGNHGDIVLDYVNNMEEPYRSIYLNTYNRYNIGNTSGKDTGFFDPNDNTINVDMGEEPGNVRGPYVTYFHESGHAIDYNFNNDGSYYSLTYRNEKGQSLYDVIRNDVKTSISNTISGYVSDSDTKERILDYFMNPKNDGSGLSDTEKRIVQQIQEDYRNQLGGYDNEAASDVYGGITNNKLRGGYCHPVRPEENRGGDYSPNYWYNNDGTPTQAQSQELWAEYYSYAATGNTGQMANLAKHFPGAKKELDNMARQMGGA